MGTGISLDVGKIQLTWSKNFKGTYHGDLFLDNDRKLFVPDWYEDEHDEQKYPGFQSTLAVVLPRIELLGHTLDRAKCEYQTQIKNCNKREEEFAAYEEKAFVPRQYMPFEEFLELIRGISAQCLSNEIDDDSSTKKRVCDIDTLKRLPWYKQDIMAGRSFELDTIYSESTSAEYFLGGFDPYTAIRLLAENPENLSCNVTWHYGPLVEAGWAEEDEFQAGLAERDCFLVVTEGSSDAAMLRHAIKLLRPETADFFRYTDMEDGYPFSGTGQLHKFIQGLIALRVPLNVIAVYDNDAEGYAAYLKTSELPLPPSYRVVILPDLEALTEFPTIGPTGEAQCDVNRRAASLECYLDLTRAGMPPVQVQWGAMNDNVQLYQGALKGKTQFMKDFLRYGGEPNRRGGYDLSKLEAVLESLFKSCVAVASDNSCNSVIQRKR